MTPELRSALIAKLNDVAYMAPTNEVDAIAPIIDAAIAAAPTKIYVADNGKIGEQIADLLAGAHRDALLAAADDLERGIGPDDTHEGCEWSYARWLRARANEGTM